MMEPSHGAGAGTESAARPIAWRVQPLIERPARALLALVVIAAFATAVALFASEVVWGFIAALILAASLNRAFLPSRYAIDAGGVVVDHPLRQRKVEWHTLDRIAFDESGALLLGPRARWSIDMPRDPALAARVIEALRTHAGEGCTVVDRSVGAERAASEASP